MPRARLVVVHGRQIAPPTVLTPLLLQSHAGRIAVDEFDAGCFERALNGNEIVSIRNAVFVLEIDQHAARDRRRLRQIRLAHSDEPARGAALG
jgi:hypothetical protein